MIGFKSFLDPTEINLTSGLTGVVGPNGCGKSNIVEAIKWVMGENSPKQMRSPEMNSIIFSGTNDRPSRNLPFNLTTQNLLVFLQTRYILRSRR